MISFVGAGPGAPDLITVRGAQRLAAADVVIWASSLVPDAVLQHTPPGVEVHDSAAMTLEDVLAVYEARPNAAIVRLHSGDPAIFGAIQEQIDWCIDSQRDFEIVPGVSSLSAAAAAVERELTVPTVAQSIVLTRLAGRTRASMPARESVAAFAAIGATTAIFLSAARPEELQAQLLSATSAYTAETPAVIAVRVSWPGEQIVRTRVGRLAADLAATGATTTALVLVGPALGDVPDGSTHQSPTGQGPTGEGPTGQSPAGQGPTGESPTGQSPTGRSRTQLYSPAFAHKFRRRSAPGSTAGRPARG